jgi:hypothetical protein
MFQAGLRAEAAALGHLKSAVQESAGNYILTSGSYRLRATILAVLLGDAAEAEPGSSRSAPSGCPLPFGG